MLSRTCTDIQFVCVFLRLCGLDLASGSGLFMLLSKADHSFHVVFIPPSSTICTRKKVFSQAVAFQGERRKKKILSSSLSRFLSPLHTHLDEICSFDTLRFGFFTQNDTVWCPRMYPLFLRWCEKQNGLHIYFSKCKQMLLAENTFCVRCLFEQWMFDKVRYVWVWSR